MLNLKYYQTYQICMLATTVAFAIGCGSSSPKDLAAVYGRVTLDGQPLAGARVEFNPNSLGQSVRRRSEQPSGSFALTDEDGYYSLNYGVGHEGAVLGEHIVKISTIHVDPERPESLLERVPAIYNVRTKLKFRVEKGENEADFELKNSAESEIVQAKSGD